MKVLLIQPPIQDFYETKIRLQPIGLAYLKSTIDHFLPGIEVKVKDYHLGWGRRSIPLPAELKYLREFYPWSDKSPFALFHHFYHFGADYDQIAEDVASEKPDLVGISSLFTPYYREVLQTAKTIKEKLDIPILVGGSHVSADPTSILEDSSVDFVIRGEGERPIIELLKALQSGSDISDLPNLGYKQAGQLYFNQIEANFSLDDIPWPDFSDLPLNSYLYKDKPLCFIMTSRGCPYDCSFCSIHQTFGKKYRRRPLDEVLEEIKFRYYQGYRVIDFEDDNINFNLKEFKKFCNGLINLFPTKDVTFLAMNGLCYQNLDDESINLMRKAGFTDLNISLVSANESVIKENKRPHSLVQYEKVVDSAFRLGFNIVSYQILGLPNESVDSMINTLIIISRLPTLIGASPFYLTPGVEFSKYCKNYEKIDMIQARLSALGKPNATQKREDIYTLFIITRIINFLKSFTFEAESIPLRELLNQTNGAKKRNRIGIDILNVLLDKKILYAYTPLGPKNLKKFKIDLFFETWNRLNYLRTQQGKIISLDEK